MKSNNKRRAFWFVLGLAIGISSTIGIMKDTAAKQPAETSWAEISDELPTLWAVAERYFPNEDPRRIIYEIEKLNPGIEAGRIQVGQIVTIPGGE